eukprot:5488183-Prymnesium_polylepis.2
MEQQNIDGEVREEARPPHCQLYAVSQQPVEGVQRRFELRESEQPQQRDNGPSIERRATKQDDQVDGHPRT